MPSADFEVRLAPSFLETIASRSSSSYNTWVIDDQKLIELDEFTSGDVVSNPRWSFKESGVERVFKCRISVPQKPIMFAGMIVDVNTGVVYHTYLPDIPAVEMCSISDLIKGWTGSMFSVDACLSAVQKFKMTGSVEKMMAVLEGSDDCESVIIRSLMATVGERTSFGYQGDAFEQIRVKLRRVSISLRTIIARITDENGLDFTRYINPETIKVVVEKDSIEYGEQVTCFGKLDRYAKYLHVESTMACVLGLMGTSKFTKTELEAMNLIEMISASPTLCGLVYSSNYPRTLKRSIFARLLDGRELSALVRNPDTVRWATGNVLGVTIYNPENDFTAYGRERSEEFVRCRKAVRYMNDIAHLFDCEES